MHRADLYTLGHITHGCNAFFLKIRAEPDLLVGMVVVKTEEL